MTRMSRCQLPSSHYCTSALGGHSKKLSLVFWCPPGVQLFRLCDSAQAAPTSLYKLLFCLHFIIVARKILSCSDPQTSLTDSVLLSLLGMSPESILADCHTLLGTRKLFSL